MKACTAAPWRSPVPPELLLLLWQWSEGQLGPGFCAVHAMQHFREMFVSLKTIAAPHTYREKKALYYWGEREFLGAFRQRFTKIP